MNEPKCKAKGNPNTYVSEVAIRILDPFGQKLACLCVKGTNWSRQKIDDIEEAVDDWVLCVSIYRIYK